MKKGYKKIWLGVAASLVASLVMAPATWAWGPERPTYTMNAPADHATFNSITDNAAVGDERDFVRIAERNSNSEFVSNMTIEAGKQYEVYIYYHNDASATYNDKAHEYAGVARDVRLISDFPDELSKGEMGRILGKITSSNATPGEVWDEAYVTAKESMTLHYVTGSAKIYNKWNEAGTVLSTRLFSPEGTLLGLAQLNGIILGCDVYSGTIRYIIQTVATGEDDPEPETPVVDPTEPENPTPTPEDPEEPVVGSEKPVEPVVPSELPETGPVEFILAGVVVAAIIAAFVYWNKTRNAVKKTTKKAKGKKKK